MEHCKSGNGVIVVKKNKYIVFIMTLSILILLAAGCVPVAAGNTLTVSGTWDLISPLQRQIIPAYDSQSAVKATFSSTAVDDVRSGKSDMAVLGREPTAAELSGMNDYVIAYDAVCMIVDNNSYTCGIYVENGVNVRKSAPFQNVTTEELTAIMNNYTLPYGQRWSWSEGYFNWKPVFDPSTGLYSDNDDWVPGEIPLYPSLNMVPGKYDTQTLLYQVLGVSEEAVAKARNNQYSSPLLDAEEEVLATEYYNGAPYVTGSGDFTYKIGFVLRRVIPVALQHVPASVVSINGIDPMKDTQSIYDGSYLLSRKIYIITRQDCLRR